MPRKKERCKHNNNHSFFTSAKNPRKRERTEESQVSRVQCSSRGKLKLFVRNFLTFSHIEFIFVRHN